MRFVGCEGSAATMNSPSASRETDIADLHFHSRFSDGALWPIELVA